MGRILWFEEVGKDAIGKVGGKNASLGELMKAGVKVPPGFAVTTEAYRDFLEQTGIRQRIVDILCSLEVDDTDALNGASQEIGRLIENSSLPPEIQQSIVESYDELCERVGVKDVAVAVRSSATAEDLPTASFAGQQDTYLWVRGSGEVVRKVVKCWASLFTPRAIAYRVKMGFPHEKVLISVGVQKMVKAKAAGVMFTLDPNTGDPSKVVIEGSWGLGETVVSGEVTPDCFVVDKVTMEIACTISPKTVECTFDPEGGRVIHREVPEERQRQRCLEDEEVRELASLAKKIEDYYGTSQDIEWSIDGEVPFPENVFIVQSRPETVWSQKRKGPVLGRKSGFELLMERAMTRIKIPKG